MQATGFWSGETLKDRLETLITPFDPERVDCSAYTLTVGHEIYVSPNEAIQDPLSVTVKQLGDGEGFTIPPGQFAFLLTQEKIEVPNDALALISIKAKIKWRGLINVSGFHVDPGFRGRLIFSVYNAGPVTVHLRQGQQMFLIWFANLDKPTAFARNQPVQESFPPDLISGISGELQSLAGLNKKIKDLDQSLTDRVHSIEKEQTYYRFIAIIIVALIVAMITTWIRDGGISRAFAPHPTEFRSSPTPTTTATPIEPGNELPRTAPTPMTSTPPGK
ncbi:dCTP deaminase domain-containing protein [Sphingobium fuliginis]|uniref:Deoxycytidine triphosphate deaminase n=1 Tax=Sphingobium fuliginis (strain ATCC 27551) TaxID=336203 RepID=A0A292ZB84_SPHSA|nr:deoxycytidine triphosphate deaminase [Sphingobium fuliginis]GAY20388.1 deoxycytidine triphosphate deaminase [Sphingobium fuliginis]